MKDKKTIHSNNKKAVQSSLDRAAKVLKAFKRDDPIELVVDPRQLTLESMSFPLFDQEVKS